MLSRCQGSVAADIGGMVRGDAPQLDSTSLPWKETGEAAAGCRSGRADVAVAWACAVVLSANLRGAMPLNCTLDRHPMKPGVLYLSMMTGSTCPVSVQRHGIGEKLQSFPNQGYLYLREHFCSCHEVLKKIKAALFFAYIST